MKSEEEWQELAKGLLRAELRRRNISYKELSQKLAEIGVEETEKNARNKISRGGFSAVFLLQCLTAIGVRTIHLDE